MDSFVKKYLMNQTFLHYKQVSKNGAGDVIKDLPVAIKGYLVEKQKLVRTAGGDQSVSSAHIFVDELLFAQLNTGDMIQPAGTEKLQPILAKEPFYGRAGILVYGICYLQ